MRAALPVELVQRRPSAVYCGTVYDQYVVLNVVDGPRIVAFDPNNRVSPEMIGSTRDVELDVTLTRNASTLAGPDPGIEVRDDELIAFRGRIVDNDLGEEYRVLIDVGNGTVVTSPADFEDPSRRGITWK